MVIFTQKQTKRAAAITSARDLGVDWDTQQNKCVDRICNGGSQTGNAYLRFAFLALSINFQASQSLLLRGYGCQTEGVIGSVVSPRR